MTARVVALVCAALTLVAPVRHWLEASMTRHMLIGVPLGLVAGVLIVREPGRLGRAAMPWNPAGIPGIVLGLALSAVPMVPRVLDRATQSLAVDAIKVALLLVAGMAFGLSWRRVGAMGQAFVIGNIGWMLGAVGVMLQEAPERLCAVYLQGDQRRAGTGLVIGAVLVVAGWLATAPW
nr:hypothetical protein [Gemmatimonadaceae bacterium]